MSPVILLAVRFANAVPTLALLPGLPGLPAFDAAAVSLFDQQSGRALALDRSAKAQPLREAAHG